MDLAGVGISNELLPGFIHPVLTDLITLAEQDLVSLEKEIQHVRQIYEDLLSKHASKLVQLTQYRFAAAPHSTLPPELLSEIFLLCIDGPAIILPRRTNAPWNICCVCSRWRTVALDTAGLWRDLYADFTSLPESEYARLVSLVAKCFSWARNAKISLHISAPETPCEEELRILLIELLYYGTKQFKHISISHAESLTPLLWSRRLSFDALKSVSLAFTTPEFLDFPDTRYQGVSMFRSANHLQSFTLTAQKDTFDPCLFLLPWAQLTELNLVDVILSLRNGHKFLQQCINLVSCRFSLTADAEYARELDDYEGYVLLKKLESLKMVAENCGEYGAILKHLCLPTLKDLEITSRRDASWSDRTIFSFLRISRCSLQRLSAKFISSSNIFTFLESSPELRQLSLQESFLPHTVIAEMMSYQLVPNLDSLSCAAYMLGDITGLLDARWLASHISGQTAISNAVIICGKNYKHRFSNDAWLLLDQLRLEGMDIVVKDRDGIILSYDGDDTDI